jgi:hypothetical protein
MSALRTRDDRSETAAICERFRLTKPAAALLSGELLPAEFAAALLEHGHAVDAIRFTAHALAPRDGIWWACQCARKSMGTETTPEEESAIAAAERWVTELSDETRRAAFVAANAAGLGTAAGSAALAVFYTGGSLTPPDAPPVAPAEFAAAPLVGGSVILATIQSDPAKTAELMKAYVAQGMAFYNAAAA